MTQSDSTEAFLPAKINAGSDTLYEIIGFRRQTTESILWQTPALSLTAQAFLFLIALAHDSSFAARLISCVLSCATSLASLQSMAKHRAYEISDSIWLEKYEIERWGKGTNGKPAPHNRKQVHSRDSWFIKRSICFVWMGLLGPFFLAALLIILIAANPCWRGLLTN
ncbi:MAG: hypothetical protein ABSB33_00375 [Tepidisphaeraceae bacterium]|jgi:hypothetical protein